MKQARDVQILFFILVAALLLSGCGAETTVPGAGVTDRPPLPHSEKGYELYSWSEETTDQWSYTLITGSNRLKTVDEITTGADQLGDARWVKITVTGRDALLSLLARLPGGEQIFWRDQAVPAPKSQDPDPFLMPPAADVAAVSDEAEALDLHLTLPAAYPPAPTRTATAQDADHPLAATLSLPASLPQGQAVPLHFTLHNNGPDPLYVLTWYTPLEGIAGEIFDVERDGDPLPYLGILAMRGDPLPTDYVLLQPGGAASTEVDLGDVYDFSIPGTYTVTFRSPLISHVARSEDELAVTVDDLGPVPIPSNPVSVTIRDQSTTLSLSTSQR